MKAEELLTKMKDDSLRMRQPKLEGYTKAIIWSIGVYMALCVLLLCECCDAKHWMVTLFTTLLLIAFTVLVFYIVKTLLSAREEALKPYRKAEMKLACVYEKVMDKYVEELNKEEKPNDSKPQEKDLKKKAYEQIVGVYIDNLKKESQFPSVTDIQTMVDGLLGK